MSTETAYFDSIAQDWDSMVYHDPYKIKTLLSMIPMTKFSKVLEVGCGTGVLIPYLLDRVEEGNLVEMDISEKMLDVAKSKYKDDRITFFCGDASKEYNELGKFDIAIAYSMFPHFEDKKSAINALVKKLKHGGILALLHSQSRTALNKLHTNANEESIHNDILPELSVLCKWFEDSECKILRTTDNEDMFAIIGQKL